MINYRKYGHCANVFQVTITRTRPDTSVPWFDEVLLNSGQMIDSSYNNTMISFATPSSDNLSKTVVKVSDSNTPLQMYLTDLNNSNSVYNGITVYCNHHGFTTTISDIVEIPNPEYQNGD
jgi:hypothetical protein